MTALPLSTEISQSSSGKTTFRVLTNKYGNGYEQRVADGINNSVQEWDVLWEGLDSTDFSTVVTALETAAGVTNFTWTPPGSGSSKKFKVTTYTVNSQAGSIYSISATVAQVFDQS